MCNLYEYDMTTEDERLLMAHYRRLGTNWADAMKVYPNQVAPVIRAIDGAAVAASMRWDFPPFKGTGYMTNFRKTHLPIWKRRLADTQYRCVVPARRFSEPDKNTSKPVQWRWFERPGAEIFAFWRPWTGDRGSKKTPNVGDHLLYSIMTTAPNGIVAPLHEKAMPVMLTTGD